MLTQRNLAFIAEKIQELVPLGAADRLISYLPLSHIAEQVVSHLLSIATGATVYFAESLEKMPENLREVRPHFFLGVPRVWEKIQAGIQAAGATANPLRRRIAAWARGVGRATEKPNGRASRPGLHAREPARVPEGARPPGARPGPHARGLVRADRQGDARLLPEPGHADHGSLWH
jgi:long-subunit acyl-CoA synthetase (AMP-forming)